MFWLKILKRNIYKGGCIKDFKMGYILTGYRVKGINLYRTNLKPLGYVVAGLGFVCLGVAVFPNGLGLLFYPLGFGLLGLVGVNLNKHKKKLKYELNLLKLRLLK